jgi:hypothetical protein
MQKIHCKIVGTSPLLMNRYNIEKQLDRGKIKRVVNSYIPEEEAEASAYWSSTGKRELIIPTGVVYASLLNASSFHKINKRSARTVLAGAMRVVAFDGSEEIRLGTDKYTIDTRGVVINKARVPKSRAKLEKWQAEFYIVFNDSLIPNAEHIQPVLVEAGQRIGIMDFRPAKGGWFGTFEVEKFQVVEEKKRK